jgi:hypothetical protein
MKGFKKNMLSNFSNILRGKTLQTIILVCLAIFILAYVFDKRLLALHGDTQNYLYDDDDDDDSDDDELEYDTDDVNHTYGLIDYSDKSGLDNEPVKPMPKKMPVKQTY